LDVRARTLTRQEALVELTPREFKLLAYFASRPGCALARDTILKAVWGSGIFVSPRSIDRCIATLRSKVEPDAHHPTYIQTIRDVGYRFDPAS
jgi:two-component system alkaline phosphatase synthesis response regulator PhoP